MKHLHPIFGGILSGALGIPEDNPNEMKLKDAAQGQKCFTATFGETVIALRFEGKIVTVQKEIYDLNGRKDPHDRHPTLFNNKEEFFNYWEKRRQR